MARNEAIARVLYMHDVNPAALRAGLIDAVTDLPFCVMWLGGTYSIRKFVDVFPSAQNCTAVSDVFGSADSP